MTPPLAAPEAVALVPQVACLAACAVAAAWDLRTREIPDWLTWPSAVAGLALAFVLPLAGGEGVGAAIVGHFLPALGSSALLLVGFAVLGNLGLVGMGDAKLLGAVGALLGWPGGPLAAAYALACGGVLSIAYALRYRFAGRSYASIRRVEFPYGLAILAGVVIALLRAG